MNMYQRYSCMYKCTILTARALHAPQLIQFFLLSSRSCLYDQLLLRIPSILKKRKNILSPTESPVLLFSRSGNRGAPESKLAHPAAPSRNRTRKKISTQVTFDSQVHHGSRNRWIERPRRVVRHCHDARSFSRGSHKRERAEGPGRSDAAGRERVTGPGSDRASTRSYVAASRAPLLCPSYLRHIAHTFRNDRF